MTTDDKGSFIKDRMEKMSKAMTFSSKEEIKAYEKQLELFKPINKKIENAIAKDLSKHEQLSWLPTRSTRVSIFAPIADKDLKDHYTNIEFKSSWGRVLVEGPALNITDEGIFLALLKFVKENKTPVVKVNIKRICEMLKISVQGRNYTRIKKAIKKLCKVSFEFEMKDGTWSVEHIIKRSQGNQDYSVIEVDPWFFDKFLKNEITYLDLEFRQSLRGDIVKALYRFLASHKGKQKYYVETLVEALNMKLSRDLRKNKYDLNKAFSQLSRKGFINFKAKENLFYDIELIPEKLIKN